MNQSSAKGQYDFSDRTKYDALMDVVRYRMTVRAFDPGYTVPREHYEMILEAARHSPSGANAQPWHFIVITDRDLKNKIMEYFREEQIVRAKLKMKFPTPDYRGLATAPGFVVIASDFRWVKAFPVLNDGSELDRMYKENAERILLQSVAAATMSAHLAAAALGYKPQDDSEAYAAEVLRREKPDGDPKAEMYQGGVFVVAEEVPNPAPLPKRKFTGRKGK